MMKTTAFRKILKSFLILVIVCNFSLSASAQNYYPAEIGNEWVLERTDGKERQTYSLERPEDPTDQDLILLKIETENIEKGKIVDTDKYYLTTDEEGIKLHKTILQQYVITVLATATANFPTPTTFFPNVLVLGDKWDIVADANIDLGLVQIDLKSTTKLTIVDFEDVLTPVGTFQNCAKIELVTEAKGAVNIDPTTSYQWLAPNVGPIKFENNDGYVYEIISFKKAGPPIREADNPPMWQLPSQNFLATGSRLGAILSAKILENVEDYVTEVDNLGIETVTGNIVPVGDGTGFATNSQSKQDLWVAGIYKNTPIIGTITLFAENSKGRTTVTIEVTIDTN